MRGRDIGVSVVAVVAAFLALQVTPDIDFQLRWILSEHFSDVEDPKEQAGHVPVPLPLVTDLDGDGKNEVLLVVDDGTKLKVLFVPLASGETLVEPSSLSQEEPSSNRQAPGARRIVAVAAGYLDPSQADGSPRHVVVVREDWTVICYDHELKRQWEKPLEHDGFPNGEGSFVVDQVAITMPPLSPKAGSGGSMAGKRWIVIGGSMRHRDWKHHHSKAGKSDSAAPGGEANRENPLGVHVEPFVEGRQKKIKAAMSDEEMRRAAEHFSFFALDRAGNVVWRHEAQIGKEKEKGPKPGAPHEAGAVPQYKLAELDDLRAVDEADRFHPKVENGHSGGTSRRRYHAALLRRLPHAWSGASDTRLDIALLKRRGPSNGSNNGNGKSGGGGAGGPGVRSSGAHSQVEIGGGQGGAVWAVVAHTREGLEAVALANGKSLGFVALPASASGAGVYADLNGDQVVDHVQAVGTRGGHGWGHLHSGLAMGHLSEAKSLSQAVKARKLPPCYALAVSGLPPREQLFNGSLCHDAGALVSMQERLSSRRRSRSGRTPPSLNIEVGTSTPAILPRYYTDTRRTQGGKDKDISETGGHARQKDIFAAAKKSDVIFAVGSGVVSSYDDEGRLNWQSRAGPKWTSSVEELLGYVVPFYLEPGDSDDAKGGTVEQYMLVAGQDKLCIFHRAGRIVGSTLLALAPSQRPVMGDFDGDGITDVVVIGRQRGEWIAAGYALAPDPGVRALFVAVLALIVAMLVVAAFHVPPPTRYGGGGSWRRRRGAGTWRYSGKSKRATD